VRTGDKSLHGPALAAWGMELGNRSTAHSLPLGSTGAKPHHLARNAAGLRVYSRQQWLSQTYVWSG